MASAGSKRRQKKPLRIPLWLILAASALAFLGLNWVVQVLKKPSELAGILLPTSGKAPAAAWAAYGDLFEDHATEIMTPELLAAIAQAESRGDPAARTYWKWRWTLNPFRVFTPASSAVGLFQITDGTFGRCRGLCVHGGRVARQRPWPDLRGCWGNAFYNRLLPSHAIEMMSACLHWQTEKLLAEGGVKTATLEHKQALAAVSHLCGPRSASADALKRGKAIPAGARCGDHDPRRYLAEVRQYQRAFARLRGS